MPPIGTRKAAVDAKDSRMNWLCRIGLHYWSNWEEFMANARITDPLTRESVDRQAVHCQKRSCLKCGFTQKKVITA